MYLKHFNLGRMPFDQLPNPDFLYLTEQHEEALTRMQYALAANDSFAIVTGEIGSGKTTLVRRLLSDLAEECVAAFVTHTRVTDVELLKMILVEFGMQPFDMGKSELVTRIQDFVRQQQGKGRRVVIVVDEAQNFDADVLEEIRLLTCMDTEVNKALNIILIGQPQLSETLELPDLEQLRQRCRLRFHIDSLSKSDTVEYVLHRLNIASIDNSRVFDSDALRRIYSHTGGIPRLINTLCDTAMTMACVSESELVTSESIDQALMELDWSLGSHGSGAFQPDRLVASSAAHMTITRGGKVIDEYILSMPSYVLGRADDCSVVIKSKFLSRHHALINHDHRGWMIADLKSTNGILVNGRKVQLSRLKDGDIVEIGDCQLRFSLKPAEITALGTATEVLDPNNEIPDLSEQI